ncbi:beta-N-acetylhexosaminidase [Streptomyces sp. NPDC087270]|uniref:beta-N-acetylhexosaminidase n=1 Tax=Streptomyces sp. NPDC087270 TaxID=3365774 RepID=UPI00380812A3
MLLPRPASVHRRSGAFPLDEATGLTAPPELLPTAHWLLDALRRPTRLPLPLNTDAPRRIALELDDALGPEEYRLTVEPEGIRVAGGSRAGVFYGGQTLLQLLPPDVYRAAATGHAPRWSVPAVTVEDRPRFAWRGLLLDVARHFMPKHALLRLIDLLALHRLNVLHLHLTDDQGWRVEIRRYPRLTEVGSWRASSPLGAAEDAPDDNRPHGGYYTQDDIREIVAFAADRHISIVPEIDVPGHSQAAIAAYPELGVTDARLGVRTRWGVNPHLLNAEESTVAFYRHVLDEITELFPSLHVGIGGDECPKEQWRQDARTQQLIAERGLADEKGLQSWFTTQLADHLGTLGRRVLVWDEALEGPLPDSAMIASWRGTAGAVTGARRGFDVLSCPDHLVYLDYRQSEQDDEPIPFSIPLTLEDAYSFDPVPAALTAEEATRVVGGQANVWTEHMDSPRTVDYYVFPRLCAVAEALWATGERDFGEFRVRLQAHLARLDAFGVEYRRPDGPLPWQTRPGVRGKPSTREEWDALIDRLTAGIRTAAPTPPPARA